MTMALAGLRLVTDSGEGETVVGEFHLDPKVDEVAAKDVGEDATATMYVDEGVMLRLNDQWVAQSLGHQYGIEMPGKSKDTQRYTVKDGAQFLIALMAKFARTTYTHAIPIED